MKLSIVVHLDIQAGSELCGTCEYLDDASLEGYCTLFHDDLIQYADEKGVNWYRGLTCLHWEMTQ